MRTKPKKTKGSATKEKANNKETTFVLCAASTMIFVASVDSPVLNAYILAYKSKFINSTCELQQLCTKYANQC